ncbi:hypothetical protein LRY60_01275 [Candidatus Woesebacteria bacterium]|nr:hypothetical protein [Candidatus Woesebacteria bacterium]
MSTLKNNDKIPSHIKKIIDAFEKDPQLEDKIKAGKHPAILYEISSDALSSEFQENPEKAEALVINASAKMELLTLLGEEGYSTLEERVENIIRKIKVLNENQPLPPIFQGAEYMLLAHAVLRHKFPEYSEDVCRLLSQIYYSSSKLQRLENNPSEQ